MKIYNPKNQTELVEIICNKCGKRIPVTKGVPQEDTLHVEKNWGYFSQNDGIKHTFDICEECYEEWVADFVEPILAEENLELL